MANPRNTPPNRGSVAAAASLLPLAIALFAPASPPAPENRDSSPAVESLRTQGCGLHCGAERWEIKTMSDPGASDVVLSPPTLASVHDLVQDDAPKVASSAQRLNDTERQAFQVKATLVGFKVESGAKGDRDFHIVLRDPATKETMIVEIPDPACDGVCRSTQGAAIQKARTDFLAAFPTTPPTAQFQVVDDPQPEVQVTGVGLYDFFHGQTGVAFNCVELHPVLSFVFSAAGPFKAKPDKVRQPEATREEDHSCIARGQ